MWFWSELLRFPNRRLFTSPLKVFNSPRNIKNINRVVSEFIHQYIYLPIHDTSKSRAIALSVSFGLSMIWHDLFMLYTLKQIFAPLTFSGFVAGILLIRRNPPFWYRIMVTIIIYSILPCFFHAHWLEFCAWNTSTIPIENQSKFRLIPLCIPYLINIFTGNSNL